MPYNPDDTIQLRPCAHCGAIECVYKALCALCRLQMRGHNLSALMDAVFSDEPVIVDEAHSFARLREADEPRVTPLPDWLF